LSEALDHLVKKLDEMKAKDVADADAFVHLDRDTCQLCHATGEDKRTVQIMTSCFYEMREAVPQFLSLRQAPVEKALRPFYYLRICKNCRSHMLAALKTWARECISRRDIPKDHDGRPIDYDLERNIPIREMGAIKMLTREEWDAREAAAGAMRLASRTSNPGRPKGGSKKKRGANVAVSNRSKT